MRIFKRRKLGYILVVILLSVCLVDFITTIFINSIDQDGPNFLYIMDLHKNMTQDRGSFQRKFTRARLFNDDTNSSKGLQGSLMENLRGFFMPLSSQTQQTTLPAEGHPDHLWPSGVNERDDRILAQMSHVPEGLNSSTPLKTIVVMSGSLAGAKPGTSRFLQDGCPVNRCFLTNQRSYARKADALLWQHSVSVPKFDKPPNQTWIYYTLESPHHTPRVPEIASKFNWTCSYRVDSTIVTPYEKFVPYQNFTGLPLKAFRNFAEGKTKKVAWFVSNCQTKNNRNGYANELKRHINVDIYGACGDLSCTKMDKRQCFDKLNQSYKFYLSFENSNCKDYITEKFFVNGLQHDVIPIVMGARKEEYGIVAPPKSFIHVDDFESPKELAEYLKKLDNDDDLYNEYFRWKGSGEFINTKFWCRLCAMVHEAPSARNHWYQDIWKWWSQNVCVESTHKNLWASWRNFAKKKSIRKTYL